jgi:hypothetical protein
MMYDLIELSRILQVSVKVDCWYYSLSLGSSGLEHITCLQAHSHSICQGLGIALPLGSIYKMTRRLPVLRHGLEYFSKRKILRQ